MKIQEDCFFYIESPSTNEDEKMSVRCINCQKEQDNGWFWEGSKRGYSQYDIKCSICGKLIYQHEEKNEEENKEKNN